MTKEKMDERIKQRGSWMYLGIQMFVFQWAAAYTTYFKYNKRSSVKGAKEFLTDIAPTMNLVMRSE